MAFMWLLMLAPKSMKSLLPIFDKIGPFFWLVPLATIVFPVIAAKRGSKWWWAVTATALITFVVFLRMALD